ncbi:hypothetical protein NC653_001980 [Populus alba x Populus x berolinensis]|uniref:Uncharacterized protein n=2 Tax=Populus TaxID=3689 RepID=A0A4U5QRI9_POPAL|nr:hypothetical protein NC653_001980 [Populus alba x Populus x berolinensis]TKS11495.1 hypothetical protein D5086_0000072690 [Populus alba]
MGWVGVGVQTQGSLGVGHFVFEPKEVWGWVRNLDPKGCVGLGPSLSGPQMDRGLESGPKRGWGLAQCPNPRGFGSFHVWTQYGWRLGCWFGLGSESRPKGVWVGLRVRTQGGWVWGQGPDPKWIWVWVLPCLKPKWVRLGSMCEPKDLGGLGNGSVVGPKGVGSFVVRTQKGWAMGPRRIPWGWVLGLSLDLSGYVSGFFLVRTKYGWGWGVGPNPKGLESFPVRSQRGFGWVQCSNPTGLGLGSVVGSKMGLGMGPSFQDPRGLGDGFVAGPNGVGFGSFCGRT